MSVSQLRAAVGRTSDVIDNIRKRLHGPEHLLALLRSADMKTRRIIANISFLSPQNVLDKKISLHLRAILNEFSQVNHSLKRILDHIQFEQAIQNIALRLLNVVHVHYTIPGYGIFHLFHGIACCKRADFECATRHLLVASRDGVLEARYYLNLIHLHQLNVVGYVHPNVTNMTTSTFTNNVTNKNKLITYSKIDETTFRKHHVQVRSIQELNNV